ncbi:hypothetical protein BN1708_008171 [Verticillium longisporum]|uniref:Uncharacterized protein n=1 Tax=Verticillium longisporum TaxID=100787 RepID=A0A0G4N1L2_VERLO|nr:hypothetical protein BN1708_008171 [Verticillium longisporum]
MSPRSRQRLQTRARWPAPRSRSCTSRCHQARRQRPPSSCADSPSSSSRRASRAR